MASYAYIMGLFRSLESKLLNSNDIERMIDAPNIEAAFKVFNDTEYADNLLEVKPVEFKKALDDDHQQTRQLFGQILDDQKILQFLFVRYDFHNIKLAFKEKYSGKVLSNEASQIGLVNAASLNNYILNQAKVNLPDSLKKIIDQASLEFAKNNSPHYIDSFLDKAMFKLLGDLTTQINNSFITNFLKLQIDIANIKIFLRSKRLNKDVKWLAEELITGGQVSTKEFTTIFDQEDKEALNILCGYFDNKFRKIVTAYLENNNLWELEMLFENYEMRYLKQTKEMSYGPEMTIAYYYAKKNALRNVRLIMTGKLNGVAPDELKARLRTIW